MDSNMISAAAGFGGAAIGGALSFVGSWIVQQGVVRAQRLGQDRLSRRELYKEFIREAAICYVDALQHDKPDIAALVVLYEKISRMRVISSPQVIAAAEQVLRKSVDAIFEPAVALTSAQVRAMLESGSADVLRNFAESCRAEDVLRAGQV